MSNADTRQLGFAFGLKSHPICERCTSSLHQDERCDVCGGDGWVDREEDDDGETYGGITTCPECFGEPARFRCPTCKDSWTLAELRAAGMTDEWDDQE